MENDPNSRETADLEQVMPSIDPIADEAEARQVGAEDRAHEELRREEEAERADEAALEADAYYDELASEMRPLMTKYLRQI